MPLDYEATERLHEELNVLFDERIKDRVEESVNRFLPMVDQVVKDHIERRLREPTSWINGEAGSELSKWIKKEAEHAADHYIRLFGGAPALREIVERLWDKKIEQYIEGEINRRFNDILKKINATATERKL